MSLNRLLNDRKFPNIEIFLFLLKRRPLACLKEMEHISSKEGGGKTNNPLLLRHITDFSDKSSTTILVISPADAHWCCLLISTIRTKHGMYIAFWSARKAKYALSYYEDDHGWFIIASWAARVKEEMLKIFRLISLNRGTIYLHYETSTLVFSWLTFMQRSLVACWSAARLLRKRRLVQPNDLDRIFFNWNLHSVIVTCRGV